jgi:hypothetical protein
MTRKDYALIAQTISDHKRMMPVNRRKQEVEIDALAHRLSERLVQDNERFDKAKFLEACGIVK